MSGIRDHCVYEFDVTFTQHHYPRDAAGGVSGVLQKKTGMQKTVRLVAPRYNEEIAKAWVRARFQFSGEDVVLAKPRKLELDGFIEERIW